MEIKTVEELARVMKEQELTVLEVEEEGRKIRMERKGLEARPAEVSHPAARAAAPDSPEREAGELVLSPTVGVFYASPSPDRAPFVQVGDTVRKGDTLCIIEAMKLMNEIPAEADGVILEICAENGQVVEYNQPLFRIV